MDYTLFFEKNDQISYALLQSFALSGKHIVTQDHILQKLNISEYKLTQVILNLNSDLKKVDRLGGNASITAMENHIYQGNNITTTLMHQVRLMYLKRSSLFGLFSYNLLTSNNESKEAFRKKHFVSKTKFYAGQLEIRDILNNSDFYKSPSLINSTEYVTRLRVFEFFYTIFNGIASPFPEMDVKVNNLIVNIQSQFNFIIKPVQKAKLEIFIKIWLLRFMNHCPLEETIIPEKNLTHEIKRQLQSIGSSVENAFNIKLPNNELNYLYTFLITQQYLPGIQEILDKDHFALAYDLTDELVASVLSADKLVNTKEINIPNLKDTLNAIHLKFTTFYVEPTTFISFSKIKFFKETYPIFHTIINQFIQRLDSREDLKLNRHELGNLYFDYMFSLISCIPKELVYDRIHICVDFSQGKLYTDYILKRLREYNSANLVLTRNLSSQTDIYLSDYYTSSVKQQQVIWRNPPTLEDWTILNDVLVKIKQQKIHSLTASQNEEILRHSS